MFNCPVASNCYGYSDDCLGCRGSLYPHEALDSTLPLLQQKMFPDDPDHPLKAAIKEARQQKKDVEKRRKKSDSFKKKSTLVRRAFRNEKETRTEIIRATQRSGAVNGDGDSRLGTGEWGVDDKLQSNATEQFTIRVKEIEKASNQKCVIVVTLKTGRKFVVATLEDFCNAADALADACRNQ